MRIRIGALALSLAHGLATAGGYQDWQFGMTRTQVMAVGDPARYYTFKNGDVGAGRVPFEDTDALLSFYFIDGGMQRAMLILHMGQDGPEARRKWASAYAHLARVCGEVESAAAGAGPVPLDEALAAYDRGVPALAAMQRHQMGCLRMPADERVWASATRAGDGRIMVAVNYGVP